MSKARGLLVRMPPGSGKTRRVWASLLRGKKGKERNNEIAHTLILTPNDKLERIWLRELALLTTNPRTENVIREIRAAGRADLRKLLQDNNISEPKFGTFRRHLRYKKFAKYRNLVLDEWHHIPLDVVDKCTAWLDGENAHAWYLGSTHVSKRIYFVSATPVNPVLEEELEQVVDHPKDDDAQRITEAIQRASVVMAAFLGKKVDVHGEFPKTVSRLAMNQITEGKYKWKYPKAGASPSSTSISDAQGLVASILRIEKLSWHQEYAYASGMVKTRSRAKPRRMYALVPRGSSRGSCFGFPYEVTWLVKGRSGNAALWLKDKHPRLAMLIDILCKENVLIRRSDGKLVPTGHKALIFCINQGVALGLARALQRAIEDTGGQIVRTSIRADSELLADEFCLPSTFPILVATEKLSESVDLHTQCKLIVHYQVPWSPLVLFQRVGRLTRLVQKDGRVLVNPGVRVAHVVVPWSVEEERINRVLRRIEMLHDHSLWPAGATVQEVVNALLGGGPSAQLALWRSKR
jgi:superfamily II DNA or RNA helicase